MNEPRVHMLSAMKILTTDQCHAILEALDCTKCVTDHKRQIYYFINETADKATADE